MRLWSIHPKYLDRAGLLALWREGLLAQKVLKGKTKGYKNHPQLERFKNHPEAKEVMSHYLLEVFKEAKRRGYNFNQHKIEKIKRVRKIEVTKGQIEYEFKLLCHKLNKRDIRKCREILKEKKIKNHPLFMIKPGEIEDWEKVKIPK